MILSKGYELGPITKEGNKYTIKIQNEIFSLEKDEWNSLVNVTVTDFPSYLSTAHPDMKRAIRPKKGVWMGELYELIQKAADEEDRLKTQ